MVCVFVFEGCGRCGRPARSGRSPPRRLARITPSPSSPRAFADPAYAYADLHAINYAYADLHATNYAYVQLRLRPTKPTTISTLVHFTFLEYVF
jgi:hypothetical protein